MATEAEKIEDGGPAFAGSRWQQVGTVADHGFSDDDTPTFDHVQHPGMSLRDWFAGQSLVGLLSHAQSDGSDFIHELGYDAAAYQSYRFADAMLKARKGEA